MPREQLSVGHLLPALEYHSCQEDMDGILMKGEDVQQYVVLEIIPEKMKYK